MIFYVTSTFSSHACTHHVNSNANQNSKQHDKVMYSCEKHHFIVHSKDLQWKKVYQVVGLKKSYRQVALALNVDVSTVQRTLKLFTQIGYIQKRNIHKALRTLNLATEFAKVFITSTVIERPGILPT